MFAYRPINIIKQLKRTISTNRFIDINIEEGVATLTFNKPPVNSMSLEALQDIHCQLDEVNKNKCKAVIWTSALPSIFSAGLDLYEFRKADAERLPLFLTAYQELFMKLYASPYISTIALNGYTGAGACLVSLMCDYRVMVNNNKSLIGINDTAVGIVPGYWAREIVIRAIGWRQAEIAIIASKMYNAEEALKVNFVDEIADNNNDAIERCKNYIRSYDNIPEKARIGAKKELREGLIKQVENNKTDILRAGINNVLDPEFQKHIAIYVEKIKQRKNKV